MDARAPDDGEGLTEFLQACRRVLTAGVLSRDRDATLAIDPALWPRPEGGEAGCGDGPGRAPERAMIERGRELQLGLAAALERALSGEAPAPTAPALLDLLLDCVRARFVYEETAMRLRGDPDRFQHARAHRHILDRIAAAKGLVRAGRASAARALVLRFQEDLAEHAAVGPAAPPPGAAG